MESLESVLDMLNYSSIKSCCDLSVGVLIYLAVVQQITKVPVQTCDLKKDCQSCVELKDPFCGWCVLEGR